MTNPQAYWTTSDEVSFLESLVQHRAESGDGGSFKITTFNAAAEHLEPLRTKGAKKNGKSCQNKWTALKKIFRGIQAIMNQSGWTWTNEGGANITPEMEAEWDTFLLRHKEAKPFKNHGWVHLKNISIIMPATLRGTHVFAPIGGTVGMSGGDSGAPASPSSDDATAEGDLPSESQPAEPSSPLREAQQTQPEESEESAPEVLAVSSPLPESRKRRHDASPSGSSGVKKKTKVTGADAIESLTQSLNAFGDNIFKALSADSALRTPQRQKDALKQVQSEIWLESCDWLVLFGVLTRNISAVDAYASLDPQDESWRCSVIEGMIAEAKSSLTAN